MASFMVGSLFAYLNYQSWKRRFIFALVSLAVPVVANWMRAYLIVMLGHLSGNQLAVGADHLVYGWVFFGVVITIVFMIGARWAEDPAPAAPLRAVDRLPASPRLARSWLVVAACIAATAVPRVALKALDDSAPTLAPALALGPPAQGWRVEASPQDSWKPIYKNPSAETQARAVGPGGSEVGVYMAYYRQQDAERKLISSENVLVTLKDGDWNAVGSGVRVVSTPLGEVAVRETSLLRLGPSAPSERIRMTVWQFYWVNGTLTSNDHWAKVAGAWHRLHGRGDENAAVVLFATELPSRPAAAALEGFVRDNLGMLMQQLDKARAQR
jgi:EpsI family protein